MDKNTVLKLAPNVLKRMEYGIDRFYLLNFSNDEIWIGNVASFLIVSQIDGIKNIEEIIHNVEEHFIDYTFEQIYDSVVQIVEELLKKYFLLICK